jgi:uncharacterized protein (TIGR03437 family)
MLGMVLLLLPGLAQEPGLPTKGLHPDWRRIGNSAIDLYLAAPATGPVDRVWFSQDGVRLFIRTRVDQFFETEDFENWKLRPTLETPVETSEALDLAGSLPDSAGEIRRHRRMSFRLYALGNHVYRSDDGGRSWSNLTRFGQGSILGDGMTDLAVSPADPDAVVVANEYGVWRSLDGGLSWTGLNESLPNLPAKRLLATPNGTRGVRVLLDGLGAVEWAPGEKQAWRAVEDLPSEQEEGARQAASTQLGAEVSAVVIAGEYSYAGARDGRLWVSSDQGQTWRLSRSAGGGPVEAFYVAPADSRLALAAVGSLPQGGEYPRVLHTVNGGLFWDDVTANLPEGGVHGITADQASGAVYAATDRGVFLTRADLRVAGTATNWIPTTENLPAVPAADVGLDPAGNQLYVVLEGYGVYAAPAPHRYWDIQVVNAADFSRRPAAPGSLLTVLGARLRKAQAGLLEAPVLHASDLESQIQIPFEVGGRSTPLALDASSGQFKLELPLQGASPAIFVDRDGTPLLLDADSGVLLDAVSPAHSNTRVQILATGLGRVTPSWPTGMAAPLQQPPSVTASVQVFVDRLPVEVTRATLAPGYVGFYLVEVQLPAVVNFGPAELYVEVEGHQSNRVRIYLEP